MPLAKIKRLLIFFLFFPAIVLADESTPEEFIDKAVKGNLQNHSYWHKLLHYRRNIFFTYQSEIDDKTFFLSPDGRKDPKLELEETIRYFFSKEKEGEQPAVCEYPARYAWLNEKLNLAEALPPVRCERFLNWKEKLAPESLSLIFSSYYLNNPASMYGHTFLKLGRRGFPAGRDLADYTVNFAAETNTNNGVMFAIKGLIGGYRGKFSTTPYYIQIQKYNNMESRDLWEYKLNFSQEEIDRLVEHLWELGPHSMAYFFFNKNCSYQLLPLLEVAKPSLDLSRHYRYQTVPLETLRSVLEEGGLVSEIVSRPSHVKTMISRRSRLEKQEIKLSEMIVKKPSSAYAKRLDGITPKRQALVLESAHDLFRYKHGFYRGQPEEVQKKDQEILLLRSKIKDAVEDEKKKPVSMSPPHKGHKSDRVGLGWGVNEDESFEEFNVRAALHDLEANPDGFVNGSQLEMFHLRFRYFNDRKKLNLEELTLIEIISLSAWDKWVHPPSWHVRTGAEVARDLNLNSEESLYYGLSGGSGYSFNLLKNESVLSYFMWLGDAGLGSVFDDGYRVGAGGLTGLLVQATPRLRYHANVSALRYPTGHVGNKVKFQLTQNFALSKNSEFRIILERQNAYKELFINLHLYY